MKRTDFKFALNPEVARCYYNEGYDEGYEAGRLAAAGERVDAPVEPTDKQLTDRWNELSYYYTPPYSWLEKMRVMLREFAVASPADAPAEPYRANLQSQGYSIEHCSYPVGDCVCRSK